MERATRARPSRAGARDEPERALRPDVRLPSRVDGTLPRRVPLRTESPRSPANLRPNASREPLEAWRTSEAPTNHATDTAARIVPSTSTALEREDAAPSMRSTSDDVLLQARERACDAECQHDVSTLESRRRRQREQSRGEYVRPELEEVDGGNPWAERARGRPESPRTAAPPRRCARERRAWGRREPARSTGSVKHPGHAEVEPVERRQEYDRRLEVPGKERAR